MSSELYFQLLKLYTEQRDSDTRILARAFNFNETDAQRYMNAHSAAAVADVKSPDWMLSYQRNVETMLYTELTLERKTPQYKATKFGIVSAKDANMHARITQTKMKEGGYTQKMFALFPGWMDLKSGHPSKLDIKRLDNSVIVELKNNHNTCNAGSKKFALDNLAAYKKANPDTMCVFGVVNASDADKRNNKLNYSIVHNGETIQIVQDDELLKLVWTYNGVDWSAELAQFARKTLNRYMSA